MIVETSNSNNKPRLSRKVILGMLLAVILVLGFGSYTLFMSIPSLSSRLPQTIGNLTHHVDLDWEASGSDLSSLKESLGDPNLVEVMSASYFNGNSVPHLTLLVAGTHYSNKSIAAAEYPSTHPPLGNRSVELSMNNASYVNVTQIWDNLPINMTGYTEEHSGWGGQYTQYHLSALKDRIVCYNELENWNVTAPISLDYAENLLEDSIYVCFNAMK